MKKLLYDLMYILIAFINLIELVQGQTHINIGNSRGLTPTDETVITLSSSENESEKDLTNENKIFSSNIKTSSYPKELSTTIGIIDSIKDIKSEIIISSSFNDNKTDINIINVQTTEIKSTNKPDITTELTKSSVLENTDDKSISTYINPIIQISDSINHRSTIIDAIEKSFGQNSISTDNKIPESNPSSEKEDISTNKIGESEFKTNIEDTPSSTNKIIPTNENTYLNFNNSVNLSTILTTSTNKLDDEKIPTTIIKIKNSTMVIDNTIKATEIINKDTSLVLLGFSNYNKYDSYFSFYTYFGVLEGYIYSNNLKFPVQITYNSNLRLLQNQEANCYLKGSSNQKISYLCEVKAETQNINNIKIIPEFNFISQKSSIIISPIANAYINNIQNLENQLDINSNLYILRHATIYKGVDYTFNVSGIINEPLPKFQKVDLVLTVNIENENKETDINCNVIDINNINYIIQCKVTDNKKYSLQNGISIIGDEILLINFDDIKNSTITFNSSEKKDVETSKISAKMGGGSVLAIILILIFFGYFI